MGVRLDRLVHLHPINKYKPLPCTQEHTLRIIWPRETPRDRAAVVMGLRPYFDAGWFNYPKVIAQDLLVVVVSLGRTVSCEHRCGNE